VSPSKAKRQEDNEFFLGNLGNDKITDSILTSIRNANPEFHHAGFMRNGESAEDNKVRDCYTSWLATKDLNFIENGMRRIIENVNDLLWEFQIKHEWETAIQVTKYSKIGHHYKWHPDTNRGDGDLDGSDLDRIISLVFCLSHQKNYSGGQLQLKKENPKGVVTFKLDYGDFVVFPSRLWHRVTPLESGERMTLVGWYL
jgi:PKHD-type hydroxylase